MFTKTKLCIFFLVAVLFRELTLTAEMWAACSICESPGFTQLERYEGTFHAGQKVEMHS